MVNVNITASDNQPTRAVEVLTGDPAFESTYMKDDSQLVFTAKNLSVPALQFKWSTQPSTLGDIQEDLSPGNRSADQDNTGKVIGGFTIKWHIMVSNTTKDREDINKEQVWDQKYDPVENSRNVLSLMNMVREIKRKNVDEDDVWKSLLRQRWSNEILKDFLSPCLDEDQEYDVILKTAKELNLDQSVSTWVPDEDLGFGKELYSIIKCPFHLTEAAKLSQFFRHLLTSHSLNTVVASTMRNIQPMHYGAAVMGSWN